MTIAMSNNAANELPIKAHQINPFRFFLIANLENIKVSNAPIKSTINSSIS
jgi:hypothetical protein